MYVRRKNNVELLSISNTGGLCSGFMGVGVGGGAGGWRLEAGSDGLGFQVASGGSGSSA